MKAKTPIQKGLAYIDKTQLKDGGFYVYSSADKNMAGPLKHYRTTFSVSTVLAALHQVADEVAIQVRDKCADYLLGQKSDQWSYNYWHAGSAQARTRPYPDDLDDTFCALYALQLHQPKVITADVVAQAARLLIHCEQEPGGPYTTWLVPPTAAAKWRDADAAVNANIANFLQGQNVVLPKLMDFLMRPSIAKLHSPYYPDQYPLLYFLSRNAALDAGYKQAIRQWLLKQRQIDGGWGSVLTTALAITTLCRLGEPIEDVQPAVEFINQHQSADGSWAAAAWCVDPAINGQTYYSGSKVITTALCIEALSLTPDKKPALKPADKNSRVTKRIKKVITAQPPALATSLATVLDRMEVIDRKGQIALLPQLVLQAAQPATGSKDLYNLADALGAFNVWGWMAYTVFDDYLDKDSAADHLPAAVFSSRQLALLLHGLHLGVQFEQWAMGLLNRIDAANAWELTQARMTAQGDKYILEQIPDYGDYWQLDDRSIGHAIAGGGILSALNISTNDKRFEAYETFIRHYVIARQLNDDLLDCEQDLRAGQCSSVVAILLTALYPSAHVPLQIMPDAVVAEAQHCMWQKVTPLICSTVEHHLALARQALYEVALDRPAILATILQPVEKALQNTLARQKDSTLFIESFGAVK